MNQIRHNVAAHAVAMYAIYLMNGYQEACAAAGNASELQEQRGQLGLAQALANLAAIVDNYLGSADVKALGDGHPGVFEYEILEPLGKWLHAHSTCSPANFKAELDRRFRAWMKDERLEDMVDQLQLARRVVDTKTAYRNALRDLEVATSGREGGWSRPVRMHVEDYIDIVGRLAHLHPTSSLEALLAIAGGKL